MSAAQNSSGSAGTVGRAFQPGRSGNPGGRPKGLARATRELVGEDGEPLVRLWWSIAQDPMQRTRDRLEASRLLADRGWGKSAVFAPQEGDPFDLEDAGRATEEFRKSILRCPFGHNGSSTILAPDAENGVATPTHTNADGSSRGTP